MTKEKKTKPGTAAELAEMYPAPTEVSVRVAIEEAKGRGRTTRYEQESIAVSPLPVHRLGTVCEILGPIAESLPSSSGIFDLMAKHHDEVYAAVSESTGWSVADVRNIHPADFYELVSAIIKANPDFFVRLLGPAVFALPGTPADVPGNGAGPKPSVSFGAGGIPTPSATPSPSSTPQ